MVSTSASTARAPTRLVNWLSMFTPAISSSDRANPLAGPNADKVPLHRLNTMIAERAHRPSSLRHRHGHDQPDRLSIEHHDDRVHRAGEAKPARGRDAAQERHVIAVDRDVARTEKRVLHGAGTQRGQGDLVRVLR